MSIRGKAAIVGFHELQHRRSYAGRHFMGMYAEATAKAIVDAGIRKEEINGIIAEPPFGLPSLGFAYDFAEYIGVQPNFATALNENAATFISVAAAAINAGYADTVLCINGAGPVSEIPGMYAPNTDHVDPQFVEPYGPVIAANGWYAQIARRHTWEYGTTDFQRARVAADQRFNAQGNENAFFNGQPANEEDILNSRLVADPLHLLEIVSPCTGGGAFIVTSAARAKDSPHTPVYLLGAGEAGGHCSITRAESLTTSLVKPAAEAAFGMAGLTPQDMDFVQPYDCYTITVLVTLEDAGFCPKGEGGRFVEDHDLSYAGDFPSNTHGGQLSFGQPGLAGGMSHLIEGVRQLMSRGEARQVEAARIGYVNGNGGIMSEQCSVVIGVN